MGLDSIELIITLEKTFGITMSDKEAFALVTPKDAVELIASKVKNIQDTHCLNQPAFYFLRKIAIESCGMTREELKTSSNIAELVPKKKHAMLWGKLQQETMIREEGWPSLSRPTWIINLIWTCVLISVSIGLWSGGWWGALLCGLIVLYFALSMTKPYCREIPGAYRNVKSLLRFLVAARPDLFKRNKGWSYPQIRQTVKAIVMDVLGVDEYDEDWEFVRDYGIG
jgi:acyl carrier protein